MSDADLAALSTAQNAALSFAEDSARAREADAHDRLAVTLRHAGCPLDQFDNATLSIRECARVVLHFHPDRYGSKQTTVAESLLEDGRYRNQFETGLSSGSRSAFPGGSRDEWERDLFGGAYHRSGVTAGERPKYGALELVRYPDGPTPRFGSCYFVLRPAVSQRTSFTFGGSEQTAAIDRLGTIDTMHCVMAALLKEVATGHGVAVPWPPSSAPTLGVDGLTVCGLLDRLTGKLSCSRGDPSVGPPGRVLDSCVEAQVHGSIDLKCDIEVLVVDPAFEGTPTGLVLTELCRRYRIPSQWHCGFQLAVEEVPDDFRGPAMPRLARRIAPTGTLDAAVIGAAESSLHSRPRDWRDWGSREDTLQHLKQLWHVLVHYGKTAKSPG